LMTESDGEYEVTDIGERVWRICNAEASKEEGGGMLKRASSSNQSVNIQKIFKFLKK
jgi:hypothetical protein